MIHPAEPFAPAFSYLSQSLTRFPMPTFIDLSRPVELERRRGFARAVWVYRCPSGHTVRVLASSFCGKNPVPGIGAIVCPMCPREMEGGCDA